MLLLTILYFFKAVIRDPKKMIVGFGLAGTVLILKHFKLIDIGYENGANKTVEKEKK